MPDGYLEISKYENKICAMNVIYILFIERSIIASGYTHKWKNNNDSI